jgi:hypothetical protein
MKRSLRLLLTATLAAMAACSSNTSAVTLPHHSLIFGFHPDPSVANAIPGDIVHFNMVLSTLDSVVIPTANGPGKLRWATSDPSIGIIDQAGNFVGRSPGRVNIFAMAYADTGQFGFTVIPPVATVRIIAPTTSVVVPASFRITSDLHSAAGDSLTNDYRKLRWTSSDTNVAVVQLFDASSTADQDARIIFKNFGQTAITLTALDEGVSTSETFTAAPLTLRTVAVDGDDQPPSTFACGLDSGGHAYCWGSGLPDTAAVWYGFDRSANALTPPVPMPVPTPRTFDSIAVASDHACGITTSGDAWCWGRNGLGQLGNGSSSGISEWINVPVEVAGGHKFTAIDVSALRSCAVTAQGNVWCWGYNSGSDDFGNGIVGSTYVPVPAVTGAALRSISLARPTYNSGSSCGESIAGVAICWSVNSFGQVGIGHTSATLEPPTPVASPEALVSVTSGGEHACGLTAAGKAYCWGDALDGVLTIPVGFATSRPTPGAIISSLLFRMISVAPYQTCGVALDGTAWCWGNSWGPAPVQVKVPGTVIDIHASLVTDCASTAGHQAWCWTVAAHQPVRVPGAR